MTDDPIPDKVRAAVLRDLADAESWTAQDLADEHALAWRVLSVLDSGSES